MIIIALALLGAVEPTTSAEVKLLSKVTLQHRMDEIVNRCKARPNLSAKALNARMVMIGFIDPPSDLRSDKTFKCVITAGRKIHGVSFGVIGKEQYLDDKGSRK